MRLSAAGISAEIDGIPIVSGVDLTVQDGQLVGLVGPNGCGKSTLLRTIYRALRPVGGAVQVGGDDVWRLSARQSAQRTAVVAQETSADFEFTAFEVVTMGRGPHKRAFDRESSADRALCLDALARVGLAASARRSFATLSGGEKQRVLVARAIAQQSRLLILDEPTNHLDVRYQLEILGLVRELGVTTLSALHDLNLAAAYCDRVYVMDAGGIVAGGAPDEVLTAELIARIFGVRAHPLPHPETGKLHLAFSLPSIHTASPVPLEEPVAK
jgi:iron complex transport system ATP-binding protein